MNQKTTFQINGEPTPRMRERQPVARECGSPERVSLHRRATQTRALASVTVCISVFWMQNIVYAQTTLSGDHVITGELMVGSTGTAKDLVVTGRAEIGAGSVAIGENSTAISGGETSTSSLSAVALSMGNAWGDYSTAMSGGMTGGAPYSTGMSAGYAECDYSVAMSYGDAAGYNSTAMSMGFTWGDGSVAMSEGVAEGYRSTALSLGYATGDWSVAMSGGVTSCNYSTAMSGGSAFGDYAVAAGKGSIANAGYSVVFGRGGLADGNGDEWIDTDPLFVLGNGTANSSDPPEIKNRNALTVYKNGKIKMDRQGDIMMGEFGEEE